MLWYAFEPMVPTDMNRAIELARKAKVNSILPFTVQRVAAINTYLKVIIYLLCNLLISN